MESETAKKDTASKLEEQAQSQEDRLRDMELECEAEEAVIPKGARIHMYRSK